jgi:outer membrane protein OmpA-like peptidoglycan-associated protein/uncharacterized lipoprotein YmbA
MSLRPLRPLRPLRFAARARHLVGLTLIALLTLAGCATPLPPVVTTDLPLAQAVGMATDQTIRRLDEETGLRRYLKGSTLVYVAPVLDAGSRQQTETTVRVRELIAVHLQRQHRRIELAPFTAAAAALSEYRLDTTLTAATLPDGRRATDRVKLDMHLVNLRDGRTLARNEASVLDPGMDSTPVNFFRDSPFTLSPADGLAQSAGGPSLSERDRTLPIARMDEASAAYAAGDYERALALYRSAATLPGVNAMHALVGTYLSSLRLGRESEAQEAFASIVTVGLKTRSMGVKLLFAPGKTDFWPDPAINKFYPEWLREIARQAGDAPSCLQVIGHSSHSGAEEFNVQLSTQRADAIRQQLEAVNPALAQRVGVSGVGWRDNLVGTGSDDLKDAVDRRVEFKVVDCRG